MRLTKITFVLTAFGVVLVYLAEGKPKAQSLQVKAHVGISIDSDKTDDPCENKKCGEVCDNNGGLIRYCRPDGSCKEGFSSVLECPVPGKCSLKPGRGCCWLPGVDRYYYDAESRECKHKNAVSHCCFPELLNAFNTMEECKKAKCGSQGDSSRKKDKMPGGWSDEIPADDEIQALLDRVKPDLGKNFTVFEAKKYIKQVVSGNMYVIKVHVGNDEYIHVKIWEKDWENFFKLQGVQEGKKLEDPMDFDNFEALEDNRKAERGPNNCYQEGDPCKPSSEACCSGFSCWQGICKEGGPCKPIYTSCQTNKDCCDNLECDDDVCKDPTCLQEGDPCKKNLIECCSGLTCRQRMCKGKGPCKPIGASCQADKECCENFICQTDVCTDPGAVDLCKNKGCGEVCDNSDGAFQVMWYCQPDGSCEGNAAPDCPAPDDQEPIGQGNQRQLAQKE